MKEASVKLVIVRTKKIGTYYRGLLKKGSFPCEENDKFYLGTKSYSGGSKPDVLQIIDWKEDTQSKFIDRLKKFCRQRKLVLSIKRLKDA